MRKLPIGIRDFKELRENDYIYVDKTEYIYNFIRDCKYYFFTRPKGFGKSLLLSTIEYIYKGEKELFKGLYIYDKWNWTKTYPVIKIDFQDIKIKDSKDLLNKLKQILKGYYRYFSIDIKLKPYYGDSIYKDLSILVEQVYEKYGKQVVVLVNEYDKPLLDVITNKKEAEKVRNILRSFYNGLKGADKELEFLLLMGTSLNPLLTFFGGLNNLMRATTYWKVENMCGFTQQEILHYFKDYLNDVDMDQLKEWYNGYSFGKNKLYNPYDILMFLSNDKKIDSYWYKQTDPSVLLDLIEQEKYFVPYVENSYNDDFEHFDIEMMYIESLMFKMGYLTIKEQINGDRGVEYILAFPNKEVRICFNQDILNLIANWSNKEEIVKSAQKLKNILEKEDIKLIKDELEILINRIKDEWIGYGCLMVVFSILYATGLTVITNSYKSQEKIELTVLTDKVVYLFKLKLKNENTSKDPEKHLNYSEFSKIYVINVEFDKDNKKISDFQFETKIN